MKKLLIILALILYPSALFAQASISVGVDDRVYRAIDRLVAVGVVDNIIVGQRPFTADEVARILIEAERNFDRVKKPTEKMMVYRLLRYWTRQYKDNIEKIKAASPGSWRFHIFDELDISYDYRSAPARQVFDNGLGTLSDEILPLFEYESGRNYAQGNNIHFHTYHWIEGPYFIFYIHPMFQTQIVSADKEPENAAFVQDMYIKTGYGNFEFEIGRDETAWGQSEYGGLMFATNNRSLDLIRFSNPHPFRLPGFLKYLGNVKGTIFLANLGPEHKYKYTFLSAWKLSLQPATFAEVGFFYGFMIGGDGAPSVSAGDVARSFFGFIPRVSNAGVSDQVGGFDFRFRIPPVWDTELYGEVYFQNPDLTQPEVMFTDRAAYLGGLYLPRLGDSHNMAIRFEYRHTSPSIYRSFIWPDGHSVGSEALGDAIGPAGDSVYFNYYYDLGTSSIFVAQFAYERRGGDFYSVRPSDGGFTLVAGRPTEERYRGALFFDHPIGKVIRAKWSFGYERAFNFNFIGGNNHNSLHAGLELDFNLGL